MQYISVSLYRKMVHCAKAEGISIDELRELPTSPDSLDHIQAVPADHFFGLHEWLDARLDPGFALRVGQQMQIDDYGVLGLAWRTCAHAREIFERSERYFKMLSNTYVFRVEKHSTTTKVYLNRKPYRRGVALSNEATFSAAVVVLQAITETNIHPVEVSFMHEGSTQQKAYTQTFSCPVFFGRKQNYIAYHTKDLELHTAKADVSINRFLVDRVEEATRGIEVSPGRIALDVEQLIRDALPGGIPNMEQIGRHMGLSTRTLTRRLSNHGVTFRTLVQKAQLALAREMLRDPQRSITEVAFQTGFSDQSAFHRAFKRWTGQTPFDFRHQG